jgi:hypothetical protein
MNGMTVVSVRVGQEKLRKKCFNLIFVLCLDGIFQWAIKQKFHQFFKTGKTCRK